MPESNRPKARSDPPANTRVPGWLIAALFAAGILTNVVAFGAFFALRL